MLGHVGTCWDMLGPCYHVGPCWTMLGTLLRTCWNVGTLLEPCWNPVGTVMIDVGRTCLTLLDHYWTMLGPFWTMFVPCTMLDHLTMLGTVGVGNPVEPCWNPVGTLS